MTTCSVCGAPGADAQSIGTNVTVFCCPACLGPVLRTFARHAPSGARRLRTPVPDGALSLAV